MKFTHQDPERRQRQGQVHVQATGANTTGYTFKCKKGTTNITTVNNLGTFTTNEIDVGKSVTITCSVKIGSAAAHSAQVVKLLTIVLDKRHRPEGCRPAGGGANLATLPIDVGHTRG